MSKWKLSNHGYAQKILSIKRTRSANKKAIIMQSTYPPWQHANPWTPFTLDSPPLVHTLCAATPFLVVHSSTHSGLDRPPPVHTRHHGGALGLLGAPGCLRSCYHTLPLGAPNPSTTTTLDKKPYKN